MNEEQKKLTYLHNQLKYNIRAGIDNAFKYYGGNPRVIHPDGVAIIEILIKKMCKSEISYMEVRFLSEKLEDEEKRRKGTK